jgi:uncharacterized protein YndB with AHSA1/START domain
MGNVIARAQVGIAAPAARVWQALTDPAIIARYFFGTTVITDWQPGSPIVWQGEYQGRPYQDKGQILEVEPGRRLKVTHFSPMTGQPDVPENYHTITYEIDERDGTTQLTLSQDNNGDKAEAQRATQTWETMLAALKKTVEEG